MRLYAEIVFADPGNVKNINEHIFVFFSLSDTWLPKLYCLQHFLALRYDTHPGGGVGGISFLIDNPVNSYT